MVDLHLVMAPARPKELGRFVSGQPSGGRKTLGWQKTGTVIVDGVPTTPNSSLFVGFQFDAPGPGPKPGVGVSGMDAAKSHTLVFTLQPVSACVTFTGSSYPGPYAVANGNNIQGSYTTATPFIAGNAPPPLAISGRVHDQTNNPMKDVVMSLSGATSTTMKTDASGNYSLPNLTNGGNYKVTPSKDNLIFTAAGDPTHNSVSFFESDQFTHG